MRTYTEEEAHALLQLVKLLEIPVYEISTMGDIETLIRYRFLAEYAQPFQEKNKDDKSDNSKKFTFPI